MVAVAQLVEPRLVVPVVAGSSPVSHPTIDVGQSGFEAASVSPVNSILQRRCQIAFADSRPDRQKMLTSP